MASTRTVSGEHGSYHFMRDLGTGGQGKTWLARRESDSRVVVVKELHFDKVSDWKAVEHFEREINALAALDHPGIPDLIDRVTNEDGLTTAIVQQYFDGHTLAEQRSRGPLSPDRYVKALRELLEVVDYLHNQVPPLIHRDIQPHNIVIDSQRARLVDFGVATWSHGGTATTVGTFGYVPQEQLLGRPVPASDLYALGMSFLAVANGMQASDFPTDPNTGLVNVEPMLARVPDVAKEALRQMTKSGLGQRVATAAAALALLDGRRESAKALVSTKPRVSVPTASAAVKKKRRLAVTISLSVLVFQIAVFAFVFGDSGCPGGGLAGFSGPASLCEGDEFIPFESATYAGNTSGDGDDYDGSSGADYAYRFHAEYDATVSFDTCSNTDFDTVLGVYDISECEDDGLPLTYLAENDDDCSVGSRVGFRATEGHDYLVVVEGFTSSHSGPFELNMTVTEAVDNLCVGDQEIEPITATYSGSTLGAADDYSGSRASDYAYSFVATETRRIVFDTCSNTDFDTRLLVYDASICVEGTQVEEMATLALLHNVDDSCGTGSRVALDVEEGRRYVVVVEGYSENHSGEFELNVSVRPSASSLDSLCVADEEIQFANQVLEGTTVDAFDDYRQDPSRDYAYSFVAASDATVTFHTCSGTEFDSQLMLYDAEECDGEAPRARQSEQIELVAQNDDACGLQSRVFADVVEGRRYVVVVEGFSESQVGPYSLELTVDPAPAGDSGAALAADRRAALTFMRINIGTLTRCHDTGLASNPSLAGEVRLGLTIESDGRVSDARIVESTLDDTEVEGCMVNAARSWKLPQRQGQEPLSMTQRFTFSAP